jgi:uncharacterized protein (TIGR03000 family)
MNTQKQSACGFILFILAGLFGSAEPANAQWLSKWGHPVITLGSTPYDSTNTGHGNYPGGPGFIPGYGYYPGPEPNHYPWMDGPGTPFDRRKITVTMPTPPPDYQEALPPGMALIIVRVPAGAVLWFNGAPTTQTGSYRRFLTPPLPEGGESLYSLRVRWYFQDAELSRVEEVRVRPGMTQTVNLLTTDSWTGRRIEMLPKPRQESRQ